MSRAVFSRAGRRPCPGGRIVQFRAGKIACRSKPPATSTMPIGQQCRRVNIACGVERAGRGPCSGRGISGWHGQFRAGKIMPRDIAARDQHLSIGQQGRRVIIARGVQRAGRRPCPGGRIVQFRAGKIGAVIAPRDEHQPVGQQRRRVQIARGVQRAGRRPCPGGRIVQFRAGQGSAAAYRPPRPAPARWAAMSPCDSRVRCSVELVIVHVPVAGLYNSALERSAACCYSPPRPAPALGQQCRRVIRACGVQSSRSLSMSRWPDCTTPRWKE